MGTSTPRPAARWGAALLLLTFVALRSLPVAEGGSFIDEYLHLFTGRSLLSGRGLPSFYAGEVYARGLHMSLWAGLWDALGGGRVLVARMAPLSLGCLSLWVFHRLSRHVLATTTARAVALSLYAVSPLLVFNHFYIRMYVVYELSLLTMLLCAAVAWRALRAAPVGDTRRALRATLGLCATGGALAATSDDPGAVMPLLGGGMCLGYLFVFGAPVRRGDGAAVAWHARPLPRLGLVVGLAAVASLLVDLSAPLQYLRSADLRFTSDADHKYAALLLRDRPVTTVLFAVGSLWALLRGSGPARMLALVGTALLGVHLISSPDLQIRRGIMYLMPVYYLVGALAVDALATARPRVALGAGALGVGSLCLAFPPGFFDSPTIPSEISYIDYGKLYAAVLRDCRGRTVVDASPSPHVGLYYGVRPDFVVFRRSDSPQDRMYEPGPGGQLQTVYGALTAIETPRALPREGRPVCLIVRHPSRHRFLSRGLRAQLARQREVQHFRNITLYRLAPGFLASRARF